MSEKIIRQFQFGITKYYNSIGQLHNMDDHPSVIFPNGRKEWFKNGAPHREGAPALEDPANGTWAYFQNGVPHRDGDEPAVITKRSLEWFVRGVRHRTTGPAMIIFRSSRNGEIESERYFVEGRELVLADFQAQFGIVPSGNDALNQVILNSLEVVGPAEDVVDQDSVKSVDFPTGSEIKSEEVISDNLKDVDLPVLEDIKSEPEPSEVTGKIETDLPVKEADSVIKVENASPEAPKTEKRRRGKNKDKTE